MLSREIAGKVRPYPTVAQLQGHVDIVEVLEALVELNDVRVSQRFVDFDFGVELLGSGQRRPRTRFKSTFVFAFFVLSDALVTTLIACFTPRMSFTSYTRANPPSPRRPKRVNINCLFMSRMIAGGDGGTALLFWRGSGGEACFVAVSCCFLGGDEGNFAETAGGDVACCESMLARLVSAKTLLLADCDLYIVVSREYSEI